MVTVWPKSSSHISRILYLSQWTHAEKRRKNKKQIKKTRHVANAAVLHAPSFGSPKNVQTLLNSFLRRPHYVQPSQPAGFLCTREDFSLLSCDCIALYSFRFAEICIVTAALHYGYRHDRFVPVSNTMQRHRRKEWETNEEEENHSSKNKQMKIYKHRRGTIYENPFNINELFVGRARALTTVWFWIPSSVVRRLAE